MTWMQRLSEFMAPPMEPSQDPRIEVKATLKALKRRKRIRRSRRKRMARYAKTWESKWETPQQATEHRPARVSWIREKTA